MVRRFRRLVSGVMALSLLVASAAPSFATDAQTTGSKANAPLPANCQVADEEAFRNAIDTLTLAAIAKGLEGVDFAALVNVAWRETGADLALDQRVTKSVAEIQEETSWSTLLQSLASREAAQALATSVAERTYRSEEMNKAIEAIASEVGKQISGRIELATLDAAAPAVACVRAFLGPRYGASVSMLVADDTGKAFQQTASAGSAAVSNTDLAILWLATARATLASHDNDIAVMLPLAEYVVAAERSADYMTFLSFRGLAMSAAGRAVCGNPEQALVTLQQLMSLTDDDTAGEDIQVFAYLALGDIGRATEVTRHHASRAATGRLSRECSDSVVLFAALAQAEGDEETARRLLLGCGIVRQSALNIAAIDLAQRLDIATQFTKHQVDSYFLKQEDPAGVLGGTRSMAILRGELDRRGWSTVGKPLLRGRDV